MDNGTAIAYVQKHPDVDRLRILSEVAFGTTGHVCVLPVSDRNLDPIGLEYLHLNGIVHGDLRGVRDAALPNQTRCLQDYFAGQRLDLEGRQSMLV